MPDAAFPALHIRPTRGWLNDPNGLCRVDGRWHVFFQYNPASTVHGDITWGHVSSADLLRWTEHPPALRPRPGGLDAAGCWSGCVTDDDGVPTAVYTAVPDHAQGAVVALATSDRTLLTWEQSHHPGPGRPVDGTVEDVRDPFVFWFEGHRYAVQGAGSRSGPPRLLLYACDDLRAWTPLGPLLGFDDPVAASVAPAEIWECPNLVELDGAWVLVLSLWRWVDGAHALSGVRYLLGDLVREGEGLRFRAVSGGVLDDGPAFYAPQLLAEQDRVLLWGWSWELGRSPAELEASGWAGVLTFPRELRRRGDAVVVQPAAELVGLRAGDLVCRPGEPFAAPAFELVTEGVLELLLEREGEPPAPVVTVAGTPSGPARVLVDGSMVEAFHGGRSVTTRAYPTATTRWRVRGDAAATRGYRLGLGAATEAPAATGQTKE